MNKKKLNIAMLGHKHIPSRDGGIEVVVGELTTRMVKLGHKVTCFNRKSRRDELKGALREYYQGVSLKHVWTIEGKGLAAVSSSFFGAVCAALGKYDIVHFHAEGPCAMLWLPKLFGKRCIATIHGLDHQRAKWGWFASSYIRLGERCAVKYADEIIVLSQEVQQYFLREYGRKTVLIPNGVNAPVRREARLIKDNYGLTKNSYILYMGRLVPEKGLKYLIEAFKRVATDKRLVIAGASSDTDSFTEDIKKIAQKDERIIFTGCVEGELWEELYSNAYVFCLPSDLEGMPLSLLEAMSYGNCCLVSDIQECVAVVEDKGITFKKGDAKDLASKLQLLNDKPELVEQYKNTSSAFILKKYNWDDIVERTLQLYAQVKN